MRAWLLLVVAVSGGLGAGLRYVADRLLTPAGGGRFPLGILIVNVSGSFALGVLTGLGTAVMPEIALALGLGLLGGYTTFSTVSVESVLLAQRGRWRDAALNLFGTLALAVLGAGLGIVLGAGIATALAL
ncbi:fluoride efflux transporter FluC [Microbacterium allomyrinae]|uniref:Fluoride-specific ion channel FluC n=1 Tax=Microbacterium allomyrinae TaxID=2830666 RepID=A0A9X1S3X2_9MICO|nr:CrcB family protein [Microbacterium allomyrinae]MCC2032952.1 CrcB family protein [Microbacterium allomyrinae]